MSTMIYVLIWQSEVWQSDDCSLAYLLLVMTTCIGVQYAGADWIFKQVVDLSFAEICVLIRYSYCGIKYLRSMNDGVLAILPLGSVVW